tara:strand:+ start:1112 stop:1432 length:321 start_codon:yes stop_codon:yes gene_type:complete
LRATRHWVYANAEEWILNHKDADTPSCAQCDGVGNEASADAKRVVDDRHSMINTDEGPQNGTVRERVVPLHTCVVTQERVEVDEVEQRQPLKARVARHEESTEIMV